MVLFKTIVSTLRRKQKNALLREGYSNNMDYFELTVYNVYFDVTKLIIRFILRRWRTKMWIIIINLQKYACL